MIEVELTWKIVLKVWWSFFWRASLFGFFAGAGGGVLVSILYRIVIGGVPASGLLAVIGYLCGVVISIWAFKVVLNKRYSKYRVAIIEA